MTVITAPDQPSQADQRPLAGVLAFLSWKFDFAICFPDPTQGVGVTAYLGCSYSLIRLSIEARQ